MDKVLELSNVTKDFGDFKLDNVSLSVTRGGMRMLVSLGQYSAKPTMLFEIKELSEITISSRLSQLLNA